MIENYRLSQKCCGNICGTKTVNHKFENKTRLKGLNLSAKGIHAHWIAILTLLLSIPPLSLGQTTSYIPHGASCSEPMTVSYPDPAEYIDKNFPISSYTRGNCQFIYKASELSACGITAGTTISTLSFYLRTARNGNPTVTIWVSETDNNTMTTS